MKIFPAIFILFAFCSCQTRQSQVLSDPVDTPFLIEFRKGPCFGTCPVSVTTIYSNGTIGFEGIRYTKKTGRFFRALDAQEWKSIKKLVRETDWWSYPEQYDSDIADLPTYTFEVHQRGRQRKIIGKEGFPETLEEIMALLDRLAQDGKWQGGTQF